MLLFQCAALRSVVVQCARATEVAAALPSGLNSTATRREYENQAAQNYVYSSAPATVCLVVRSAQFSSILTKTTCLRSFEVAVPVEMSVSQTSAIYRVATRENH